MPMNEDNYKTNNHQEEIFSRRVRAGKRTYFFDVKATRNNDYYITITESKRSRFDDGSFLLAISMAFLSNCFSKNDITCIFQQAQE